MFVKFVNLMSKDILVVNRHLLRYMLYMFLLDIFTSMWPIKTVRLLLPPSIDITDDSEWQLCGISKLQNGVCAAPL